jgi:hypothetical protein
MQTRSVLVLALLLAAAGAFAESARADIVILEGNDVPLTGRIIGEDDTTIRFRIRGLKDSSYIVIEKSRIRRFWREENAYWDHVKGENDPRVGAEDAGLEGAPGAEEAVPAPPPVREPVPTPSRTKTEIRSVALDEIVEKAARFVPHAPGLRILGWLAVFGAMSLLLFIGGRIAELSKMKLGRAAVLSLVTQFLVLLGVLAHRAAKEPATFPLVVAGLVVCWILTSRMLAGDRFAKSVLLLSFTMAFLLVLAGSVFSVMTVL